MAQYEKLVSAFDTNLALSFVVGSADIVAHRLYKQHTDGTLVIAGDNETAPLFVPTTAEKAGYRVQAIPLALGTFELTGSGDITAGAKLSSAANGKVKAAAAGDPVVASAYNAAADGEHLSVLPAGPAVAGGASIIASGSAVLVAGTVTVANTAVLDTDLIFLTRLVTGGTVGNLSVGTAAGSCARSRNAAAASAASRGGRRPSPRGRPRGPRSSRETASAARPSARRSRASTRRTTSSTRWRRVPPSRSRTALPPAASARRPARRE